MDKVDEAQASTQLFYRAAFANRPAHEQSTAAIKVDPHGHALCVNCDIDISARRNIVPHTQRCTECQADYETRLAR